MRFTLHENGKMMERPKPGARRVALRVTENYSQTSPLDQIKEHLLGRILELLPLRAPHYPLCEQECL